MFGGIEIDRTMKRLGMQVVGQFAKHCRHLFHLSAIDQMNRRYIEPNTLEEYRQVFRSVHPKEQGACPVHQGIEGPAVSGLGLSTVDGF
jgi:hypothetical protein